MGPRNIALRSNGPANVGLRRDPQEQCKVRAVRIRESPKWAFASTLLIRLLRERTDFAELDPRRTRRTAHRFCLFYALPQDFTLRQLIVFVSGPPTRRQRQGRRNGLKALATPSTK